MPWWEDVPTSDTVGAADAGPTADAADDTADAVAEDAHDTTPLEDVQPDAANDADAASVDTADTSDLSDVAADVREDVADDVEDDIRDVLEDTSIDAAEDTAPACEIGRSCDDGDPCTLDDVCSADGCVGQLLDCSSLNTDCTIGQCVEGSCEVRHVPNGLACTDADLCTANDICTDGVCAGETIVCEAPDTCTPHVCEPSNGTCVPGEPLRDGTSCDDGNSCTMESACEAGQCVGFKLPDGSACDDGTSCTESDECFDGVCTSDPVLFCDVFFDPCIVGACIDVDGEPSCVVENVADGEVCDDQAYCSLGFCLACVADTSDPSDDTPAGATTSEAFGDTRSLCPNDVDHVRLTSSSARTTVIRVDSERCDAIEGVADNMYGEPVDTLLPSSVSRCPLFEVADRQVLRLQSDAVVPSYGMTRGDFISDVPTAIDADSALEIDALGGWSAISSLNAGDVRWYAFTLTATRLFTAETGAFYCGVDTLLTLFDESAETVLFSDDDGGQERCSRISRVLPAGRYFLQVRGFGSTAAGTYTMHAAATLAPSVVEESESNDTREMADSLVAPARATASLRVDDVDWFTFTLEEESEATLFTEGLGSFCDVDTLMSLYDAAGTLIRTNDDTPGRGLCSEIVALLPAGTYFVELRGFRSTSTGSYVLDFSAD